MNMGNDFLIIFPYFCLILLHWFNHLLYKGGFVGGEIVFSV